MSFRITGVAVPSSRWQGGSARSERCENGRCRPVAAGRKEPPSVKRVELFEAAHGGRT